MIHIMFNQASMFNTCILWTLLESSMHIYNIILATHIPYDEKIIATFYLKNRNKILKIDGGQIIRYRITNCRASKRPPR